MNCFRQINLIFCVEWADHLKGQNWIKFQIHKNQKNEREREREKFSLTVQHMQTINDEKVN